MLFILDDCYEDSYVVYSFDVGNYIEDVNKIIGSLIGGGIRVVD